MKAYVLRAYGPPTNLELTDVDQPVPADHEVLVRNRATSINPYDWHHMRGEPVVARLLSKTIGLRAPNIRILGCDMAGEVEAVGQAVTRFKPGDAVFALLDHGGFAEYVAVPEDVLVPKPQNMSFEQAAAVPMAAMTALLAVRDVAHVASGQEVLVNGATGGVGSFAVQMARAAGATVTAVCGPKNADLAEALGATTVIDYQRHDFTNAGRRYDAIVDVAGQYPARRLRRALLRDGTLVLVGGQAGRWFQPMGHMLGAMISAPVVRQRVAMADTVAYRDKPGKLAEVAELITADEVIPVIDQVLRFEELPSAVERQELGHARGKIVVAGAGTEIPAI
ncbi:Alcohol dehydrogenase GroES domain protein [Catenulispora acidiphila DSM 44928]|uniref:Alcohol dehydrogenase GroES domain protein n=1 Tax=Catenulispora acidiphila (strain DSM 44928 / JCM 14897 / NBRC 102108 / NRRL B-24433 / ID139908) TaxID=479433 RepID=C7Q4B3_CATAD|nr:NAD(P)-dependent alcohol dehydrogenase [Catenulispora acidiphila]ACU69973.1 Alcohol dehydrogenase GroES domain protein [Catenulispora acidiphila DSM 44928]